MKTDKKKRLKRKIIEINEELCTGCGDCIPNCAEGALQIIDGKARLISDLFCDGLGACIGHCPEGAISIVEREAEPYNERRVLDEMLNKGPEVIRAHLEHLLEHGADEYYREGVAYLAELGIEIPELPEKNKGPEKNDENARKAVECACPGSAPVSLKRNRGLEISRPGIICDQEDFPSLVNWPLQIFLAPVNAPYFNDADILVAADCTAFAAANFHEKIADGRVILIGCPKLDDAGAYSEKLGRIFTENSIKSVSVAHMSVPCCFGLIALVKQAIALSGKNLPCNLVEISIDGQIRRHESSE